ncbi:hypothetical protein [Bifidobacterium apicola]|uniref:hypothetical protein n=1 Tax=Bifidobacterium apicola TaxID=3230739 RepID=UPI0036F36429
MPQQGNKAAATDQAAISQPDKQEKQEGETALQQAEGNGEQTPAWFYKGFKALPYVILVFAILLVAINRSANKIGPQNRLNFWASSLSLCASFFSSVSMFLSLWNESKKVTVAVTLAYVGVIISLFGSGLSLILVIFAGH